MCGRGGPGTTIRQWVRIEENQSSERVGREILEREVRKWRYPKLDDAAVEDATRVLNLNDGRHLFSSVGQGDLPITQALRVIYPEQETSPEPPAKPTALERLMAGCVARPAVSRSRAPMG